MVVWLPEITTIFTGSKRSYNISEDFGITEGLGRNKGQSIFNSLLENVLVVIQLHIRAASINSRGEVLWFLQFTYSCT